MGRFASLEEAKWVVENLNGTVPRGLQTVVSVKYANRLGGSGGGGGGPSGGGKGWELWGKGFPAQWNPMFNLLKGGMKGFGKGDFGKGELGFDWTPAPKDAK